MCVCDRVSVTCVCNCVSVCVSLRSEDPRNIHPVPYLMLASLFFPPVSNRPSVHPSVSLRLSLSYNPSVRWSVSQSSQSDFLFVSLFSQSVKSVYPFLSLISFIRPSVSQSVDPLSRPSSPVCGAISSRLSSLIVQCLPLPVSLSLSICFSLFPPKKG